MELLQEVRNTRDIPVILLTANDMETDIVGGLESGADDYITKSFSLAVLRARVNTQLRRNATVSSDVMEVDPFSFDFGRMEFRKNGRIIELSKTEQKLLRVLVEGLDSALFSKVKVIDGDLSPLMEAEAEAERYLSQLSESSSSPLAYESKATQRAHFREFQMTFAVLGGLLCAIIGIVGILNYFNAVMTSILSRRLLEQAYWFYSYHYTITAVLLLVPVFAVLGYLIPSVMYRQAAGQSVVERLREAEA